MRCCFLKGVHVRDRNSRIRFAARRLRRSFLVLDVVPPKAVQAAADQVPANDVID